jgi:hypothetical protein
MEIDGGVAVRTSTRRRRTLSSANCSSRRFWPRRPRMSVASCSSCSICLRTRWISLDTTPNLCKPASKHMSKDGHSDSEVEKQQRWSVLNLRCWRDHYGSWAWSERRRRWTASAPWRRRGSGGAAVLGGGGDRGEPGGARRGRSRRSAGDAAPLPRPPCLAARRPRGLGRSCNWCRVSRGL